MSKLLNFKLYFIDLQYTTFSHKTQICLSYCNTSLFVDRLRNVLPILFFSFLFLCTPSNVAERVNKFQTKNTFYQRDQIYCPKKFVCTKQKVVRTKYHPCKTKTPLFDSLGVQKIIFDIVLILRNSRTSVSYEIHLYCYCYYYYYASVQ